MCGISENTKKEEGYKPVSNACKLCSPLGASIAYKGFEGCVPLIHGSQGCATYIRRYLISHFREPVDIASSNFSEDTTIFGGNKNFQQASFNVINQYRPEIVGVASTCLSETIGDDLSLFLHEYKNGNQNDKTDFVFASTPSYQGTHMDGFHEATSAVVQQFAEGGAKKAHINLFPGFLSTSDLRYLKQVVTDFGLEAILFPDYSETLDNPVWKEYHRIPRGGTSKKDIKRAGTAQCSIEFGTIMNSGKLYGRVKSSAKPTTAAEYLDRQFGVMKRTLTIPIGIKQTDLFFSTLSSLSGNSAPERHEKERGRLIDAYVDGHKYVFGKKAVLYGEEDFVVAMASFLDEIGVHVILAASGGRSGRLENEIKSCCEESRDIVSIREGVDFEWVREWSKENRPDILIGHSKGYYIARELDIPILRVGFPIHDRIGGQRILHVGYAGALSLYDQLVNLFLEEKQRKSSVGYKYM